MQLQCMNDLQFMYMIYDVACHLINNAFITDLNDFNSIAKHMDKLDPTTIKQLALEDKEKLHNAVCLLDNRSEQIYCTILVSPHLCVGES